MKFIDEIPDKKLIFLGAISGYLITSLVMIVVMGFKDDGFKLSGVLFFPFALSAFIICTWYAPKIIAASSLTQSICRALVAAALTSLLTGALTGIVEAVTEFIRHPHSRDPLTFLTIMGLFMGVGFMYSLPGMLISGIGLGKLIFERQKKV